MMRIKKGNAGNRISERNCFNSAPTNVANLCAIYNCKIYNWSKAILMATFLKKPN